VRLSGSRASSAGACSKYNAEEKPMKNFLRKLLAVSGSGQQTHSLSMDAFIVQKELIANQTPMIFDVGAHVGIVATKYRELFPKSVIHCFEPFPKSFQELRANTGTDANTFVHKIAMSERKGTSLLTSNSATATNSLLPSDERASFYWGDGVLDTKDHLEVETADIDSFCSEHHISVIDILKIDVQGAEFSVLVGASNMLSSQAISLIYTELITAPTYQGQHKLVEYLTLFDSFGYQFLDFYNPVKRGYELIQADMVFLSSQLKKSYEDRLARGA
jgi:FkbM family methyltransferase